MPVFLSSCFSYMVVESAKEKETVEAKKVKIKSAFIDTANNLVVNFSARESLKATKKYHIVQNLDAFKDTVTDYDDDFFNIIQGELVYVPRVATQTDDSTLIYINDYVSYGNIYVAKSRGELLRKHKKKPNNSIDVTEKVEAVINQGFVCFSYNDTDNKILKLEFRIEKYERTQKRWYWLLPVSISLDILTLPVQVLLLILGMIYFLLLLFLLYRDSK